MTNKLPPYTLRSLQHQSTFRGRQNTTLNSSQSLSGRSSIMTYRNTQYLTASAALDAYISDFENHNPSMIYQRTVEDLLSPTVQHSLETGVRDTKEELRLYEVKKMMDESYQQIVKADAEMQRACDIVKSSKLHSHSLSNPYLSPLPGSNITVQLTENTVSTDAMLHAPAYPQKDRKPASSRASTRYSVLQARNQGEGMKRDYISDFKKQEKLKKQSEGRTLSYSYKDPNNKRHSHNSAKNNISSNSTYTHNLYHNHTDANNFPRVSFEDSLPFIRSYPSSVKPTYKNSFSSSPPSHSLCRDTKYERLSNGERPPPSWIEDFEVSGRSPVSRIDVADISGRPPPIWIQDLDVSGVSIKKLATAYTDPMQTLKHHRSHTSEASRTGNMINVSSVSDLLVSDTKTPYSKPNDKSKELSVADLDHSSPSLSLGNYNFIAAQRTDVHKDKHRPMNHGVPHRSRNKTNKNKQNKTINAKDTTSTVSFTTDDLVRVSPTGRDFSVKKPNRSAPNSGLKLSSHGYSLNRFAKVAWDDSNSTSCRSTLGDGDGSRSKERQLPSSQYSGNTGLSTNTDSLIYTPPRVGLVSEIPHKSRLIDRYDVYGKPRLAKLFVPQADDRHSKGTLNSSKVRGESRERAKKMLDMTETQQTRLQSSPNGDGNSFMPSLHTSPIAAGVDDAKSFLTEDILEGDRPWEKDLPSFKPPHPVEENLVPQQQQSVSKGMDVLDQFLDDCLVSSNEESPRLTDGKQPGPVEALKNMLFTLQKITPDQQALVINKEEKQMEDNQTPISTLRRLTNPFLHHESIDSSSLCSSTLTSTDFDEAPGAKSLQRAMHHLSQLKSLVYDTASCMDDNQNSKPISY